MDSNSEIQGYNFYPMLHFCRKFSSGVTASLLGIGTDLAREEVEGTSKVVIFSFLYFIP